MTSILERIKSWLTQAAVIFTVTVLIIAITEGIARQVVRSIKWSVDPYMVAFTDDRIRDLYNTDDPGFYREVLSEGWGSGVNVDYAPFMEFLTRPYRGTHVNVSEDGFRILPDGAETLDSNRPQVFVFGGSTVFGMGVSDGETIPAYLQQALNQSPHKNYDVFNFGVVSFYSTQERVLFERLINLGHIPDVAVFVDGLNDSIACHIPDATEYSARIENALSNGAGRTLLDTYSSRSNVVKLIKYYTTGESVDNSRPGAKCTAATAQVDKIMQRLDSNRRIISGIGDAFGIKTIFVQQPVAYFGKPRGVSAYEPPDVLANKKTIRKLYEKMTAARTNGTAFNKNVLWLENDEIDASMYVDNVHYSPQFNAHIGQKIFDHLSTMLD